MPLCLFSYKSVDHETELTPMSMDHLYGLEVIVLKPEVMYNVSNVWDPYNKITREIWTLNYLIEFINRVANTDTSKIWTVIISNYIAGFVGFHEYDGNSYLHVAIDGLNDHCKSATKYAINYYMTLTSNNNLNYIVYDSDIRGTMFIDDFDYVQIVQNPPKKYEFTMYSINSRTNSRKWNYNNFPWRISHIPSFKDMLDLLKMEVHRSPYDNKDGNILGTVTRQFPDDILLADSITDWYAEEERMKCSLNGISPFEYWSNNQKATSLNPYTNREALYREVRACNLFNITLGIHLLIGGRGWSTVGHEGPGDVLDPAAGWGDRLGACYITGARSYHGWDTNVDLQPVYKNLSKAYENQGLILENGWSVTPEPFEFATLRHKYDTVITSPPFYNVEIYQGSKTSTSLYRNKQEWLDKYYYPMWDKCAKALKPGGRVIAYIADWMYTDTNQELEKNNLKYVGYVEFIQCMENLSLVDIRKIRKAHVWVADKSIPDKSIPDKSIPDSCKCCSDTKM